MTVTEIKKHAETGSLVAATARLRWPSLDDEQRKERVLGPLGWSVDWAASEWQRSVPDRSIPLGILCTLSLESTLGLAADYEIQYPTCSKCARSLDPDGVCLCGVVA